MVIQLKREVIVEEARLRQIQNMAGLFGEVGMFAKARGTIDALDIEFSEGQLVENGGSPTIIRHPEGDTRMPPYQLILTYLPSYVQEFPRIRTNLLREIHGYSGLHSTLRPRTLHLGIRGYEDITNSDRRALFALCKNIHDGELGDEVLSLRELQEGKIDHPYTDTWYVKIEEPHVSLIRRLVDILKK